MTAPTRAADRSPIVERSRKRSAEKQKVIVDAAYRLIAQRGSDFTTQDLVKEAGVALQTFYRYFASKDQLLLAVIEDMVAERAVQMEVQAQELPGPVERLHYYITAAVQALDGDERDARFVTAEHWRLHQLFPDEISHATQPFGDLIERELRAAAAAGLLEPGDPAQAAWFTMKLVQTVFHHYSFVSHEGRLADISEALWSYCLRAFCESSDVTSYPAHGRPRSPRSG